MCYLFSKWYQSLIDLVGSFLCELKWMNLLCLKWSDANKKEDYFIKVELSLVGKKTTWWNLSQSRDC